MSLRLEVKEDLENRFRKTAMATYGYGKGALKRAAEDAFEIWMSMKKQNGIERVENPVRLIEGMFSKLKGKYASVELQHEAKGLWIKK